MLARHTFPFILFTVTVFPLISLAESPRAIDQKEASRLFETFCVDCHHRGSDSAVDIESLLTSMDVREDLNHWTKIEQRLFDQTMPPAESAPLSSHDRKQLVQWVKGTIHDVICEDGISPSRPTLRRLNRSEYANTVRDLLGIHVNAAHALPHDGAGGEGFDNAAETLFISPIHAEKYLDAAREALSHALLDPDGRQRLLINVPDNNHTATQAAEKILVGFLPKAFRRPVSENEISDYLTLFEQASREEQRFEPAIRMTLEAAMTSPKFLFHLEEPTTSEEPIRISSYELANRLSYFLWNSMPDTELFQLAKEDQLQEDEKLVEQVRRMLHSPIDKGGLRRGAKVREFATNFIEQWLGTRALGREFQPADPFSALYDSELEGGMKYEPIFFFEHLLSENESVLELIDSDFTYLNNRLARHYGVRGVFREQPKHTALAEGIHRGGLLGMSAVLAVSSLPHRTSPVLRGKWILETLLGTPPPPPPPNIPELEKTGGPISAENLRKRLEEHRDDPNCSSCHDALDPLGFSLENYDVLGSWRDTDNGVAVDARGSLPDGTLFSGPEGLKEILMLRKDQFVRHLTSKMLGFALGRSLTPEDRCVVDEIAIAVAKDDYRIQTMVIEIVKSVPFRYKVGGSENSAPQ
ncbi:MAG: DUF1592 domain-containing protein [Rubripirellula sp.]